MHVRDFFEIVRRNILQPVVVAIYTLAVILLYFNETRDALFLSGVITLNTLFAIVQEIRAKRSLHKLELMNQPRARVPLPDGTYREILFTDVKVGDTLVLLPGDEVPADGTITESLGLEVDESILTGESRSVPKENGDTVLSSTVIAAGSAHFTVIAVGVDTRAGQMTAKLKTYRPELTPLQILINKLIFYLTFVALGLIALILVTYWYYGYDIRTTMKVIASAGIAVIPEGLLLASTVLLAFGSLKLAQQRVLPQKLSAIEGMALLDVLCTDKTGTLTKDEITFDRVEPLGRTTLLNAQQLTGTAAALIGGGGSTADAILRGLSGQKGAVTDEILAFSSTRKLSGARFHIRNKHHSLIMGAPEYVARYAPISKKIQAEIEDYAKSGLRVLLVATMPADESLKKLRVDAGKPLCLILLRNELRDGVIDTVQFLQRRGVSLRVISGDNPSTVSYIAEQAGIKNPHRVITGNALAKLSRAARTKAIKKTTIFARVLPEQKEDIIKTLQRQGSYTGMVGDGVNDALALKQSNLGVAMYAGAAASRRVADIVLLNNSFNSLPVGMRLGNRIMQAIEIVTVLSFHKIIYGITLLLLTIALGYQYPFLPRHNTFINIFAMTLPTLMWTLFPPLPRHRVDPKHFWRDTLFAILPTSLMTGVAIFLCQIVSINYFNFSQEAASTLTVVVTMIFAMSVVLQSGRLFAVKYTKSMRLARIFYLTAAIVVASGGFGLAFLRNFFDFWYPQGENFLMPWPLALIVVATIILQFFLIGRARQRVIKRSISVNS